MALRKTVFPFLLTWGPIIKPKYFTPCFAVYLLGKACETKWEKIFFDKPSEEKKNMQV